MAKFEIKIDTKSIQKKMKATEEQIKKGVERGLKLVASEMKDMEQEIIANSPQWSFNKINKDGSTYEGEPYERTGYLMHSVWIMPLEWSPYGATISVTNVAKYAIYNELGTGIFASNGDGREEGWVYPIGGGQFRFTIGMPPKFFVRDTRKYYNQDRVKVMIEDEVYTCLR